MKKNTVYIVHHTYQGTPESGEIHEVCATKKLASLSMKKELIEKYNVTPSDNWDDIYMFISGPHTIITK